MNRWIFIVIPLVFSACTPRDTPAWEAAEARPLPRGEGPGWDEMGGAADDSAGAQTRTGSVTAVASVRPPVANVGVQLPRVSPDGKWIAFLDQDSAASPVQPDDLITGNHLDGMSLWVRGIDTPGVARNLAVRGAAWPTWSPDGKTLAFVGYDDELGCTLGLHDLASGVTRRKGVGLRQMMMPAISPDGRRVAVVAYGEVPNHATIFIIDLDTDTAMPGPPPFAGDTQVLPRWLNDKTLLYVELFKGGEPNSALMRWGVGGTSVEQAISGLDAPASVFDAQFLHAAIAEPLSPDRRSWAYYSPGRDRIELIDLDTGRVTALREGFRAGAWWGSEWFIAADADRIDLVETRPNDAGSTGGTADEPLRLNLLTGRWVPIWADAEQQSILLLGESERPDRFDTLQLWVVAKRNGR